MTIDGDLLPDDLSLATHGAPTAAAEHTARLIIHAAGIGKTYRSRGIDVVALRDVSLDIPRGQMLAIMGPSGSGKTTLLNCLAGLDSVDAGVVAINGVDLAALSDRERTDFRARTMGFIFQSFNLLPVLSAVENVELPLLVVGASGHEARLRARALLDAVGLAHRENHRPAELSGGQRQRVAIARALINEPAIIWADEPTGNLDSESADDVLDLLRTLNRTRGQTMVIVTHAAEVGNRADRIVRVRDGSIVSDSGMDAAG